MRPSHEWSGLTVPDLPFSSPPNSSSPQKTSLVQVSTILSPNPASVPRLLDHQQHLTAERSLLPDPPPWGPGFLTLVPGSALYSWGPSHLLATPSSVSATSSLSSLPPLSVPGPQGSVLGPPVPLHPLPAALAEAHPGSGPSGPCPGSQIHIFSQQYILRPTPLCPLPPATSSHKSHKP